MTSRWYVRRQILWFLFGSVLSCAASVACVAVTSIGVHHLSHSARRLSDDYDDGDDAERVAVDVAFALHDPRSWSGRKGMDDGSRVVTANIFVTAMAEMAWSAISIQVAYKGAR